MQNVYVGGPDPLVIHDGQLLTKSEAWASMLEEFPPYGHSEATIKMLLERELNATQDFLSQIVFLPVENRWAHLSAALKADAEIAAKWRATAREEREAHAKRLEDDLKKRQEEQQKYRAERQERHRLQQEVYRRERAKAEWQFQFDRWVARNEEGGRDAGAEQRAAQRKAVDQKKIIRVLKRIEEVEQRYQYRRQRGRSGSMAYESMLNLLSDHDYIQWMFRCRARGFMFCT